MPHNEDTSPEPASEYLAHPRQPEVHTILAWNPDKYFDQADAYIQEHVLTDDFSLVHSDRINLTPKEQRALCASIYGSGNKVKNGAIHLWVVRDNDPVYQWAPATSCKQVLNIRMKRHKEKLRTLLGGSPSAYQTIHTSYNTHEALCVLRPLALKHLSPRIQFSSFRELFQRLEEDPHLQYVVQRSYHELANSPAWFAGRKDVDVLVSDYYHFKALTGARGHGRSMRDIDNGHRIQNQIVIGGNKINFDVRFVGDNYVDSRWEHDMLGRSVTTTVGDVTCHIPMHDDELYSLLYNVLVQKPDPAHSKHRPKLRALMGVDTLPPVSELWKLLKQFMDSSGYSFKRPRDRGVGFRVK